jgi:dephospho-CoA kinase
MTKREQMLTIVLKALSEIILENDKRIDELEKQITEIENDLLQM